MTMFSLRRFSLFFLLIFSFLPVRGQDRVNSHPLAGRWIGEDRQGNRQTFVFGENGCARWILESDQHSGTFEIKVKIDYRHEPHHVELSGFESGPLSGLVLYGILTFDGNGEAFRLDVEPGSPEAEPASVRPVTFSEQAVTYRLVRSVQHLVLVWLKEPGNRQHRQQLIETSQSFASIPGVRAVHAGEPLKSNRPVVDDSFDVAVVITFESIEAMNRYENHPMHVKAVEEVLRPLTERMVVYDFVEQ